MLPEDNNEKAGFAYVLTADVTPLYSEELFEKIYNRSSTQRKIKTDRLRFMKDKALSLGAEYLLMCACHESGENYSDLKTVNGINSKPYFENSSLKFNLSHSGNVAMCVVSDIECGCDCEKIGAANERLVNRFFSEREKIAVGSLTDDREKNELFYRLWTLKESYMKCTGCGFSLPMNEFTVNTDDGISVEAGLCDSDFRFYEFDYSDGYRYAVCLNAAGGSKNITVKAERKIIF